MYMYIQSIIIDINRIVFMTVFQLKNIMYTINPYNEKSHIRNNMPKTKILIDYENYANFWKYHLLQYQNTWCIY